MSNHAPDYILCADDISVLHALHNLSKSSIVIFDCEGDALGREGGSLSIITLRVYGTTASPGTYLIDAFSISPAVLRKVIAFIVAPTPLKVVFDGRMDFTEIYFTWKVRPSIGAVLDLTLLELSSRQDSQLLETERLLYNMRPDAAMAQQQKNKRDPSKVKILIGLVRCARERKLVTYVPYVRVDHTAWLDRPLTQTQLEYAAMDALLIEKLYTHLYRLGYISIPGSSPFLWTTQTSYRFVTMWMDVRKPPIGNIYFGHCLLPLGIIDPVLPASITRRCEKCQRQLLPTAFSQGAEECHVCAILPETRFWRRPYPQSPK
ncbi:hypothetical protein DL96DRAFT_1465275 [Flagelloscypha sp. PMI_526]|nr:hypothetical protein DL96DRAFT_1465275 [Flagelloscypha sp. PMI_526]